MRAAVGVLVSVVARVSVVAVVVVALVAASVLPADQLQGVARQG